LTSVLEILPVKLKKQLSLFDRFIINGVPIDMKPLVHPVVGLSRSGNKVDLSHSGIQMHLNMTRSMSTGMMCSQQVEGQCMLKKV
jgi:hypothetical protein